MRPVDYLTEAAGDLRSSKLRSLLTSLGIIIGVGSVVLMLSLGEGVKQTVLGLGLAGLGALVVGNVLDVHAAITPGVIALALGVSSGIGIFFGVVPAWRAARLDPISALRHE